MVKKLSNRVYIIVILIISIVFIDQLTKFVVKKLMNLRDSIGIVGDFFQFTYIENPGMAFGLQLENKILFTLLSISAAIVVFVYLYRMRNEKMILVIALSFILGGAIGNLIDRLIYGKVVDFLDFEFFDISIPEFSFLFIEFPGFELTRWPIFNIADTSVSIGLLIITWMIFFVKDKTNIESTA
jgi:signal peptidase II